MKALRNILYIVSTIIMCWYIWDNMIGNVRPEKIPDVMLAFFWFILFNIANALVCSRFIPHKDKFWIHKGRDFADNTKPPRTHE